jgi:hypothetical protein
MSCPYKYWNSTLSYAKPNTLRNIAKGRGQKAFMQKGCILTGLGFSIWRCPNHLGDCYNNLSCEFTRKRLKP